MNQKRSKPVHREDRVLEALIKGKQPVVHSTFRLTQEAHDAIKELGNFLGIKNAELFDRLLIFFEASQTSKVPVSLEEANSQNERIRKTYVVNKDTLSKLSKLVKVKKATRDLLIENTANALRKILEGVLSDKKEQYRKVLEKTINPFWREAEDIENKLRKELGDDPIVSRFAYVIIDLMNLSMAIESYLNKGTLIDPDDSSQQS